MITETINDDTHHRVCKEITVTLVQSFKAINSVFVFIMTVQL